MGLRTLDHYEANADAFWAGTRDHDVSQNIDALVTNLRGEPPFVLLDLGCGPGRDLAALRALGHTVIGLDGCASFCEMARRHSGCEVWHQDFLALDLPAARFAGIFANASLFHVPSLDLPRVLVSLRASLKEEGVLLASNPRGDGREGWNGGRYGCYFDLSRWRELFVAAGYEEIQHYYRPSGRPRAEQSWLVTVWRK